MLLHSARAVLLTWVVLGEGISVDYIEPTRREEFFAIYKVLPFTF